MYCRCSPLTGHKAPHRLTEFGPQNIRRTVKASQALLSRTSMSACSSQLSLSLLGGSCDEADSAGTADPVRQRQPRSASAGRLHTSTKASPSIRPSKHSAQPRQPAGKVHRTKITPASPRSPALPAESVASQGRTSANTPQSSASTGQSHATSGSDKSSKPRWQQSTAASSRHQHSSAVSSQASKPSFLNRLQAQDSHAASDKQQQLDAKAAEMKAKLQEWRQQQKEQNQQHQQQRVAQKAAAGGTAKPAADAANQAPLQPRRGGTAVKGRASSADPT